jgi:prepilin-type N-terminal cleavage/methylation domain-containing protein
MKARGFTLIELMIVLAIGAILCSVVVPALFTTSDTSTPSQNSRTVQSSEFQCKGGFLFKVTSDGDARPASDAETRAPGAPKC